MNIRKAVGLSMLAAPIVAMFSAIAAVHGPLVSLGIAAFVACWAGWVVLGVYFIAE